MTQMATPISDHAHPKITEITFSFLKLHQQAKYQFTPSVSWDAVNFRVLWPDWPCPFLTMSTQKIFDQLLIYVNLYKYAKNQAICPAVLQSDWLRTFWPKSQEQKFSQIWDLCWNTANYICFHHRTNSVKINDHIFQ